jgi:hypothetical protein
MSKQCKLVLRELSKSLIYRAQTYFHPQARQYFTLVDVNLAEGAPTINGEGVEDLAAWLGMDTADVVHPWDDGSAHEYESRFQKFQPFEQRGMFLPHLFPGQRPWIVMSSR